MFKNIFKRPIQKNSVPFRKKWKTIIWVLISMFLLALILNFVT